MAWRDGFRNKASAAWSSRLRWCPRKQNRRIKTDRRDAVRLAHFLRSGDLVEVSIPEAQTEAMRDLERAREDAIQVERVARQQLDKFLLRHGRRWSEGSQMDGQTLEVDSACKSSPRRPRGVCWRDYIQTVEQASARVQRLTADIGELVERWTLGPLVRALQALRGVDLVTAVVLAAEIGNFKRFRTPKQLMAYLGPGAQRTLQRRRSAAGRNYPHGQSPCALGAGGSRLELSLSSGQLAQIHARRQRVAAGVRGIAERAEQRLLRRFRRLIDRGKSSQKAVTAVARELVGFVWAIAQEENLLAA